MSCECGEKGEETFEGEEFAAHTFDQEVAEESYFASAATCTTKATYFKSCICGEKGEETFESGELIPHVFEVELANDTYLNSAATCTAKATFFKSCECGEKGTETFENGDYAQHIYDKQVVDAKYFASAATCTAKATYFKSCVCGEKDTETFETGDFAHEYTVNKYDEENHWKECECGEIDQDTVHAHEITDRACACGYKQGSEGLLFEGPYNRYGIDNLYVVSIGTCTDKDIVIPATYNGYPVVEIKEEGFADSDIRSVEIPASVEIINDCAFRYCRDLETATIKEGSKSLFIDRLAFYCCSSLTSIELPSGVGNQYRGEFGIVDRAFDGCNKLVEVVNNSNFIDITTCSGNMDEYHECNNGCIGHNAIGVYNSEDEFTTKLSLEDGFVYYTDDTRKVIIDYRGDATDITIHNDVTEIWKYAFEFSAIESVTFEENSILEKIGICAFRNCTEITEIEIPASVKIMDSAFASDEDCAGLQTVTCAETNQLESVAGAFSGCTNLKVVSFGKTSNLEEIFAFGGSSNLEEITIPSSVKRIGTQLSISTLKKVTFAENSQLEELSYGAFESCLSLTEITIPASVKSIGMYAFDNCQILETVTFESGSQLETIDYRAFLACEKLKSINIPASVSTVGEYAFSNCGELLSVEFSKNLSELGAGVFDNCVKLHTVVLDADCQIENIPNFAFRNCGALANITLPESITSIGDSAFESCHGLTGSIAIPASVKSIGEFAFHGCHIEEVSFGANSQLESIANSAFGECSYLTNVEIPSSITSIDMGVFIGCYNLTYYEKGGLYYLGNSTNNYLILVKGTMGNTSMEVEDGCKFVMGAYGHVTEVVIPASVISIGDYVFANNSTLGSITYTGTVEDWSKIVLSSSWKEGSSNLNKVICSDGEVEL